jgi:O-antigen ligase
MNLGLSFTLYLPPLLGCAWVLANGDISNAAFLWLVIASVFLLRRECFRIENFWCIVLFSSPISAVAIGQLLRADLSLSEFDSPLRILLGSLVFLALSSIREIDKRKLARMLAVGSAFGLIFGLLSLNQEWTSFYGGRFATTKSAPNDLGGYSGLLLIVVMLGLFTTRMIQKPPLRYAYLASLVAGAGAGAYLLLGTQSRGPWLVTAVVLTGMLGIYAHRRPYKAITLLIICGALVGSWTQTQHFQKYQDRFGSALGEPYRWLTEGEKASSGGARLSMLPASVDLFLVEPLRGFGDFGYSPLARTPEFAGKYGAEVGNQLGGQGGPHNEIAARSLQSGIWGLIATVFLLVYPIYRFGRQTLKAEDEDQRDLSFMGLIIITYIFLLSFVLEPYSLKHTATFNALILAVLLGATANRSPNPASIETTTASDQMEPDKTHV